MWSTGHGEGVGPLATEEGCGSLTMAKWYGPLAKEEGYGLLATEKGCDLLTMKKRVGPLTMEEG